jgi:hypothetical protein
MFFARDGLKRVRFKLGSEDNHFALRGLRAADARRPSSAAAVRHERPSESERRQGQARCRDTCAGKRPLDCAPFVAQGKRDDSYTRRAAESTAFLRSSDTYKRKDNSCEVR